MLNSTSVEGKSLKVVKTSLLHILARVHVTRKQNIFPMRRVLSPAHMYDAPGVTRFICTAVLRPLTPGPESPVFIKRDEMLFKLCTVLTRIR